MRSPWRCLVPSCLPSALAAHHSPRALPRWHSPLLTSSLCGIADCGLRIARASQGYEIEECRRLEPIVLAHYHASLVHNGILDYSLDDLKRDWQLACMHFPYYVAMWFGTTPDEELVDPSFPRRFVPRAFDAIIRNGAGSILPANKSDRRGRSPLRLEERTSRDSEEEGTLERLLSTPMPGDLKECQAALLSAREAISELRRQRDAYKAAVDEIRRVAGAVGRAHPSSP